MTIAPDPPMFPPTPSIAPPTGDLEDAAERAQAPTVGIAGRVRKFLRGKSSDPPWVRLTLLALLGATSLLYIWGLSASGWANSFYSAAAQAGSTSWKAFFFGSSDAANSITVDKPAMSLWPQALAIRAFGLNSWSILVPEALMGVATVGVLYAAVRRWFNPAAGLLAGLVMALTPAAALMFRFNNPDALLTLLMTIAAYTALRAIDDSRARWFVLTGVAIGFGFLTKQLQVLLVVPALGGAYLLFGKPRFVRRLADLALAFVSMIVAAGWWVAIVQLWPASSRPYIGGSQTNSIIELTLGYNGLGRLTGEETGSVGGGGPMGLGANGGIWGPTGITRMFANEIGGQIAWLIPAALAMLLVGLWITRRAPRTDPRRASLILWGGWLIVTGLTFSFMSGIFHAYYTVALAPPIAALVGIGATMLWARRTHWSSLLVMAGVVLSTGLWAVSLLGRAPTWEPWLADWVRVATVVVTAALVIAAVVPLVLRSTVPARIAGGLAVAAAIVALAAPTAWTLETVSGSRQGAIVTAGPPVAGSAGPGGFGPGNLPGGGTPPNGATRQFPQGQFPQGQFPQGQFPQGQFPQGQFPQGQIPQGQIPQGFGGPGGAGGLGGLLGAASVSDDLAAMLRANASDYTWVAATTGSNNASAYQLATEQPVMPIGGFNGSDPSPTLEQFQQYVANGEIHYYIASGLAGANSMDGSQEARDISTWVEENFTAQTVDGVTLYDLTASAERPS